MYMVAEGTFYGFNAYMDGWRVYTNLSKFYADCKNLVNCIRIVKFSKFYTDWKNLVNFIRIVKFSKFNTDCKNFVNLIRIVKI